MESVYEITAEYQIKPLAGIHLLLAVTVPLSALQVEHLHLPRLAHHVLNEALRVVVGVDLREAIKIEKFKINRVFPSVP